MSFQLSPRSLEKLEGPPAVHPDLVRVVKTAILITPVDFGVIEGFRTLERQKDLLTSGATRTLNSRHLTGHAVDLAAYIGGTISWAVPLFQQIMSAMKQAAYDENVPLTCGGNWINFKDYGHFELPWKAYPA